MDGEEKFAKFLTRNHVISIMRRDPHSTELKSKQRVTVLARSTATSTTKEMN